MTSVGTVYLRRDQWRIELVVGSSEPMLFDKMDVINDDVTIERIHGTAAQPEVTSLMVKARHMQGKITAQPLDHEAVAVGEPLTWEGDMEVQLHSDSNDAGPQLLSVRIKHKDEPF